MIRKLFYRISFGAVILAPGAVDATNAVVSAPGAPLSVGSLTQPNNKSRTFTVNTGRYLVEIDIDGRVLSKTRVGPSNAMEDLSIEKPGFSQNKVNLEYDLVNHPDVDEQPLLQQELAATQKILAAASERIEKAMLMDLVAASPDKLPGYAGVEYIGYQIPEVSQYLLRKGVAPRDMGKEYGRFVAEAQRRTRVLKAKRDAEWRKIIISHPSGPGRVEAYEQVGSEVGTIVGGALGIAATAAVITYAPSVGAKFALAVSVGYTASRLGEVVGRAWGRSVYRDTMEIFEHGTLDGIRIEQYPDFTGPGL